MTVYQFKCYDSDSGETDFGFFKTRALAMKEKKRIEKMTNHKFSKGEYEFINIKVREK